MWWMEITVPRPPGYPLHDERGFKAQHLLITELGVKLTSYGLHSKCSPRDQARQMGRSPGPIM